MKVYPVAESCLQGFPAAFGIVCMGLKGRFVCKLVAVACKVTHQVESSLIFRS